MKNVCFFLLAAIALLTGCKATVEGETNAWKSNVQNIDKLGVKYPNFKTLLQQSLKEAQPLWDAAQKVSGDEPKIQAMKGANAVVRAPYIASLDGFEDKVRGLRDRGADAQRKIKDPTFGASLASQAQNTASSVDNRLRSANPASIAEANVLLEGLSKEIADTRSNLDKALEAVEKAEKDAKQASEDTKKVEEDAKKAEEAKTADVKCGYCGTMNKAGYAKCGNCGAPRE
jgi:chromosome segregation ATPase